MLTANYKNAIVKTFDEAEEYSKTRDKIMIHEKGTISDVKFKPDFGLDFKGRSLNLTQKSLEQLCKVLKMNEKFARRLNRLDSQKLAEVNEVLANSIQKKFICDFTINEENESLETFSKDAKITPLDMKVLEWTQESLENTEVDSINIGFETIINFVTDTKVDIDTKVGDMVGVGLSVKTSEFNLSNIQVRDFFYRYICTNGMIVAQDIKNRTLKTKDFDNLKELEASVRFLTAESVVKVKNLEKKIDDVRNVKLSYPETKKTYSRIFQITKDRKAADKIVHLEELQNHIDEKYPDLKTLPKEEIAKISTDYNVIDTWNSITSLANDWNKEPIIKNKLQEFGGAFLFGDFNLMK